MDIEAAVRDLAATLESSDGARGHARRIQAARHVVVTRCLAALGTVTPGPLSIATAISLAANAPDLPARRYCAVLVLHALGFSGLVPPAAAGDVCRLVESALPGVLLRCGYPFAGSIEDKMRVLQRLHTTIAELMRPMEPTFPSWIKGLHAG